MVNFWLGLLVGLAGLIGLWQRYRHDRSQWQKRLQQVNQTLQDVQRERDALIHQYQPANQRLQELEQEYQVALARLQALETENQSYQQQVQQLEQNYRQLQDQLNQTRNSYQDALNDVEQLEQEKDQLRHDHQVALARIQVLETENQKLERTSQHYHQQMQHLEQNCRQLHHQLDQTRNSYQDALNYVEQLEREKEQLQEEVEQLLEYIGNGQVNRRSGVPTPIHQAPHVAVIFERTESDLYPDEIYDTVLSVLKIHMDGLPDVHRRRHDILQDILACNPPSGNRDRFQQEIKSLFAGYQGKTERLVRDLGGLGFEFLDSPKHYKIKWRGDDRYIFSFAKTPSDYRAGANIARDLIRLLF